MQTKPKSNSVITHSLDATGKVLTFVVREVGNLDLNLDSLHGDIRVRAMVHGLIQRVSDAAALGNDKTTGKPASAQDKFDAMAEIVNHYNSGTNEWRTKGTSRRPDSGKVMLIAALCEFQPNKTREQVTEWLGKQTSDAQVALRQQKDIKAIIDRLESERTAGIDADELLSGL